MNFTKESHDIIKKSLKNGDIAIDATMGNGYDTLFLSDTVGPLGKVYAFDIQENALISTQKRLEKKALYKANSELILSSHENIYEILKDKIKKPISCAIFNLGYLPNYDKSIITKPQSTLKAILDCMKLADSDNFILSILCYIGHENGKTEFEQVKSFFDLNIKNYQEIKDESNELSPILLIANLKKI